MRSRWNTAIVALLPSHAGPTSPLIEDLFGLNILEVRQEIIAILISPALADKLSAEVATPVLGAHHTDTRRIANAPK
jgi:GntR family transcriptional regulator